MATIPARWATPRAVALAVGVLLAVVHPIHATTFDVNDSADAVDTNPGDGSCATAAGKCTLRAAIQEANALAGADEIRLQPGEAIYRLTRTGIEDLADAGDLDIGDELVIVGRGTGVSVIDGEGNDRVFQVLAGVRATLRDLTIQGGSEASDRGAGVQSFGVLRLERVAVVDNLGIGVYADAVANNASSLDIVDSHIAGNGARFGGGIWTSTRTQISGSTVEGNRGIDSDVNARLGEGGGIFIQNPVDASLAPAEVTIVNSTISRNVAEWKGGGIDIVGVDSDSRLANLTLNNVTITRNVADLNRTGKGAADGGGLLVYKATVTMSNTIIAGNRDLSPTGVVAPDCYVLPGPVLGTITSEGYNLVGSPATCDLTCTLPGGDCHDRLGDDPLLGPLGDYGGVTPTHLLLEGSPARSNGSPLTPGSGDGGCERFDQRGVDRPLPSEGLCDIGAVQVTAIQPICGNAVVEEGEECDDGAANSDSVPGACRTSCRGPSCGDAVVDPGETCDSDPCCEVDCGRRKADGAPCGEQVPAGECDQADRCDGAGVCQPNPRPVGEPCTPDALVCTLDQCDGQGQCAHPPGNAGDECNARDGDCDRPDTCDAQSPTCPPNGAGRACLGTIPPEGDGVKVDVECVAPDNVGTDRSFCTGDGVLPGDVAQVVIKPVRRPLRKPKDRSGLERRTLHLRLNERGRRLLQQQGNLTVIVRVMTTHGSARVPTEALVRFLRKLAGRR
jgi:hypothetical protein